MSLFNHYFSPDPINGITPAAMPYSFSTQAAPGSDVPNNALRSTEQMNLLTPGVWPALQSGVLTYVEDHRGERGYVNGEAYTIKDMGPYPSGWSDTPPPLSTDEQLAILGASVQVHLDSFAQTREYDSILHAASYGCSTNAKYLAEGEYAITARDTTWAKWFEIRAAIISGTRPVPTWEQVQEELPALVWPV